MKKIICSFAFAAVLTAASTADASALGNQTFKTEVDCFLKTDGTEVCKEVTLKPDQIVPVDPVVPVFPRDPVDPGSVLPFVPSDPIDPVDPFVTTATVSSCPPGTTKSSDGCCCVNN